MDDDLPAGVRVPNNFLSILLVDDLEGEKLLENRQ